LLLVGFCSSTDVTVLLFIDLLQEKRKIVITNKYLCILVFFIDLLFLLSSS